MALYTKVDNQLEHDFKYLDTPIIFKVAHYIKQFIVIA